MGRLAGSGSLRVNMGSWNPITGCLHNCSYCWARGYAGRLASMGVEPYRTHGFSPAFADWRLKQKIPKGSSIFVSDMGDMWGEWVPFEWIERVLKVLRVRPDCSFLFLTKNPARYNKFLGMFTENMMLGATIETNRNYKVTSAPAPKERFEAMKNLNWKHKVIVIEPIFNFDSEFINWITDIRPEMVYIGYDNYNCRLPEPPLSKTIMLKEALRAVTDVEARALRKAWFEG